MNIDVILNGLTIVGWKENEDRQKQMRQAVDDYLFELDKQHGLGLEVEQIDLVIDAVLERARAVMP